MGAGNQPGFVRADRDAPARAGMAAAGAKATAIAHRALQLRILDTAINGLRLRAPHHSAARRVTPGQAAWLGWLGACAAILFALAPGPVMAAATGLAAAGFSGLIGFRFWAAAYSVFGDGAPEAAPRASGAQPLPVYSVLVPLYRETAVIGGLIAALEALDYPRRLLDVKLVVEEDDHATLRAARALAPPHFQVVAVPPGGPRTKPKALTYALAFARGRLLAIYDAEDRPHPAQLRAAAAAFRAGGKDLVCVQAPLTFYNARENFLTRCFALEYAVHFRIMLPALLRAGAPIPLGGTSNHFRIDALRDSGGWDPFNVTEDADLGFRLGAMGGRIGMIAPPTWEEATCRLWPWVRQRSRWLKGYAQTLLVHTRGSGARLSARGAASLWLTLGGTLAAALLHGPALVWLGAVMMGRASAVWPGLILMASGYVSAFAAACAASRASGDRSVLWAVPLTPFYWPLQSVAAVMALWQLAVAPFYWEKTEHGVSRTAWPDSAPEPAPHPSPDLEMPAAGAGA